MRILFTLFTLITILINSYFIVYLYWLKEYKVTNELPTFYKYILLDSQIKEIWSKIEWQNILTEKWGVRIIKEQNFLLSKDSIISWTLIINKKIWSIEKAITKEIENMTLNDIYLNNEWLDTLTIKKIWKTSISKLVVLDSQTIINILKENDSLSWSFNSLY